MRIKNTYKYLLTFGLMLIVYNSIGLERASAYYIPILICDTKPPANMTDSEIESDISVLDGLDDEELAFWEERGESALEPCKKLMIETKSRHRPLRTQRTSPIRNWLINSGDGDCIPNIININGIYYYYEPVEEPMVP